MAKPLFIVWPFCLLTFDHIHLSRINELTLGEKTEMKGFFVCTFHGPAYSFSTHSMHIHKLSQIGASISSF